MSFHDPITPAQFYQRLFGRQAARDEAVVRRQIRDKKRFIGRQAFLAEMHRRSYPVVETAGQFVTFCNRDPIRRLV